MKSIVFFYHPAPTNRSDYDTVLFPGGIAAVRAEVIEGDPEQALNAAEPREGETLLNTVALGATP